jgi:hypothetical protein
VKAWPVRLAGKRVNVLLDNKGSQSVSLEVRISGKGDGTLQRLLAPSAGATSGVTLAGQQIGPDANWTGAPTWETIHRNANGYLVTMPPGSAAVLSVRLP